MPLYDFRCDECDHVFDALVAVGSKNLECTNCGLITARRVWLSAPKLDWSGMAMGPNAGPEFIDRFERSHVERRKKEEAHKAKHGDELRGAGA